MKRIWAVFCASVVLAAAGCSQGEETAKRDAAEDVSYEPMAPFAALAGKAWRGEGTGPNGRPIVDIARYQMILGGRAFQSTHKLEGETYGGRTIIFYDEGAEKYIFHYFTTAGFHTAGEIVPTDAGFTAVEEVQGHSEIAEVRSEAFFGDGIIRMVSSHVTKDGAVSEGDELVYREIDDPGPLF